MRWSAVQGAVGGFFAAIMSLSATGCTSTGLDATTARSNPRGNAETFDNASILSALAASEASGLHTAALQFAEKLDRTALHKSPQLEASVSKKILTDALIARDVVAASKWIDGALSGATADRAIILKNCITIAVYQQETEKAKKCADQLADGVSVLAVLMRFPPTLPRPRYNQAVRPQDYPPASVVLRQEGIVKIEYVVGLDGTIGTCRVVTSSGISSLDEAACPLARKRWTFEPATRVGFPIVASLQSDVTFSLDARADANNQLTRVNVPTPPQSPGMKDFVSGNMAFNRADWFGAINFYTKALDSGDLELQQIMFACQNRGVAHLRKYEYEDAIDNARLIEAKDKIIANSILGIAYIGLHRYDEGITALTRAMAPFQGISSVSLKQREGCVLYARGVGYRLKGDEGSAAIDFAEADRLVLSKDVARYCLGIAKLLVRETSGEGDIIAARKMNPSLNGAVFQAAGWLGGF